MTPYVTVDPGRLEANLRAFTAAATEAGVAVRAHVKGHRTVAVAVRQVAAGAVGIAVHAAAETQSYVDAGVSDVVVAWPWRDDWRWARFADLATRCRVAVHVDRPDVLAALGAAATARGVELGVRVELDSGLHRTGVPAEEIVPLARKAAATPGLHLDGVTGYVPILSAADGADRWELGARMARALVHAADAVRAAGLPCPVVSVGGTATAPGALSVRGVTEVCAGAYAFYDGGHALLGACRTEDVAIALTTTVTGRAPDGTPLTDADDLLAGADQTWAPGVRMTDLLLAAESGGRGPPPSGPVPHSHAHALDGEPAVGTRLRVHPGHVCPVVARCPALHLPDGTRWQPIVRPDRP